MISKRAIIIGAGNSIRTEESCSSSELSVWNKIKDEFTIGTNFVYNYITPTVLLYKDYKFFIPEEENLKKLPLVFTQQDDYYAEKFKVNRLEQKLLCNNIYAFPGSSMYNGSNSWKQGFLTGTLSGIFAITMALVYECKEIFLLGFDAKEINGKTHFYQDELNAINRDEFKREKSGVGKYENGQYKTNVYNQKINNHFKPFIPLLEKIKIFNVSPESNITVFPKISYDEFYDKIKENKPESQDTMRFKLLSKYYAEYYT